jgi:hypothetical protein
MDFKVCITYGYFSNFNNGACVLISVQCSVCSPKDGVFSTPKNVGTLAKFLYILFNFVYDLVKLHVVVIVHTQNGQF